MFISGNIEQDVFEQNSELLSISQVVKLVKETGRKKGSRVIWAVFQLEDPNSLLYRMPKEQRRMEIEKNYINGEFDLDTYEWFIGAYREIAMTKEQRMFKIWGDKLEAIMKKVDETDLESDANQKTILYFMTNMTKFWDAYEKVKASMIKASLTTNLHGGSQMGAREKRLLKNKKQ